MELDSPAPNHDGENMQEGLALRRTARIDPDRRGAGILAIMLVVIVMGASMAFSFKSLRDTAEWTPAPEWARTMAPLYIDGAILAFTVSLALFRWRRHDRYARSAKRWLYFSTISSMLLNGLHTAAFHSWNFTSLETFGGIIIASGAPLFALVSAEQIIRLVFQQPEVDVPGTVLNIEPVLDAASGVPGDFLFIDEAQAETVEAEPAGDVADAEPEEQAEPAQEAEPAETAPGSDDPAAEVVAATEQPCAVPPAAPAPIDHEGKFVLPPVAVQETAEGGTESSSVFLTPSDPATEQYPPMSISYS